MAAPLQERALRNPVRFCPGREGQARGGDLGLQPWAAWPAVPDPGPPPFKPLPLGLFCPLRATLGVR